MHVRKSDYGIKKNNKRKLPPYRCWERKKYGNTEERATESLLPYDESNCFSDIISSSQSSVNTVKHLLYEHHGSLIVLLTQQTNSQ